MMRRFLILLSLICTVLSIRAKTTVKQFTNINGLSNNSINCIYQDSESTMWFGTWDGLNSFNGRDFKTYRYSNDTLSISNNVIRQIIETEPSHLWISTDLGINRYNKISGTFDRYFVEESLREVRKEKAFLLSASSKNTIIAYVYNLGLFYYDQTKNHFIKIEIPHIDGVKNFTIYKDQLYFLYMDGLIKTYNLREDDNRVTLSGEANISSNIINIFTSNNSLILYSKQQLIVETSKNKQISINTDQAKTVSDVLINNQKLTISYLEGGLEEVDLSTKQHTILSEFPQNIPIFSIYRGSQNIIWVGTDAQGIFQIYDYKPTFSTVNTSFPVRTFFEKNNNTLFIGTKGGGIEIYDKEKDKLEGYISTDEGLISNSVYCFTPNRSNHLFIGTEGDGINIMQNQQVQKLIIPPTAPYFSSVYSIQFTNNDSVMWLGTAGFGLIKVRLRQANNRYYADQVIQYSTNSTNKESINNDVIYSIVADEANKVLWVSTRRTGLYKFDLIQNKFVSFDKLAKSKLSNNDVLSLFKQEALLWVGTSFGINRIDLKTFDLTSYTTKEGLLNNTIHGILQDKNDVWISTNRGLSKINEENGSITNYTFEDGLQNDEFSDGAYYHSDSLFYFGGVSGFNYFNPQKIDLRAFKPTISVTNLRIFNDQINVDERIQNNTLNLSYHDEYTTITFLSKDYINNENCEYAYRLVNFSDEWINNGKNPNIVLTNLLPGKYNLQVKVSNGDRVWNDYVYTLKINVGYPWWLSTYAIIAYIFLFIAIVFVTYILVRNRIRLNRQLLLEQVEKENQKKIHESKLDFFTNVAHEFFTPLTLIYGPAQHLLDQSNLDNYTKRYVQVIKNNAERMQKLISELMDFRKVESGHTALHAEKIDIQLLISYITDNYIDISEETKIKLTISTENISYFTTDRNSLEKIIFNLISNAFKYTPNGGYIDIHINQNVTDRFEFRIRNSGKGLTQLQIEQIFNKFKIFGNTQIANTKSTGIGLSLVKSLTELLGGTIEVSSKIKEYVEFCVNLHSLNSSKTETESISDQIVGEENLGDMSYLDFEDQKHINILIVEDEKDIRELLKDILEPHYTITEATDGMQALDMIEQNTPDIIISDILMPNLDGTELLVKLKDDARTAHIPVINITAKTALDDKISAYEQGAELYITKPFHPRHVLATVGNILKKQNLLKQYYKSSLSSMTIKDGIELHLEDEKLLQEIIIYIEKNIDDENLNPNTIAEAFGFSKASLYRKLEMMTQKTPSEFVRSIRLNHAANLLKSTKLTVQEIMFKSGFLNKSYFYREFAKVYNTSPSEYRKLNIQ